MKPRLSEPARNIARRFFKNRLTRICLAILLLLSFAAIAAPLLAPHPYELQNRDLGAVPPGAGHWLGTDDLGRDLLTRLLYGGRVSLAVGIAATMVALGIGVTYGTISGYAGGKTDQIMMRIVDALYALPFTVFVIVLMVVFGRNLMLLFVAIGAVEWLTMARIVRGQVLALKEQTYIRAARSLGFSHARIMLRHMLPNMIGPVIVYTTLTIPRVILLESFLSFLGLGVQPPKSSWGLLIRDGARAMETYPWLLIVPGITLCLALFALNCIGDALRDAMDPRHQTTP
jgi:oligopeptide transport system permease protein